MQHTGLKISRPQGCAGSIPAPGTIDETRPTLMIIFDLMCDEDHPFEGWFQSAESFEEQLASGMVACPQCGSNEVRRVPSAIHLMQSVGKTEKALSEEEISSAASQMLSVYQQLVSTIIASTEDVGKEFAEEARRIHYMEAPLRSIRGEVSAEEFQSLFEEGIDVMQLPMIKKEDLN